MPRVTAATILALLVALGCSADTNTAAARDGDAELYVNEIQPIMRARCGFLGCHGREGMPLTVYTRDYLRMRDPEGLVDPQRSLLDERAVSDAELTHNRQALAARVGRDDPEGDIERVLLRLIPEEAGGIPHADVAVYDSLDDPEIAKLRQFLESVR